jgi:hypothetical protein
MGDSTSVLVSILAITISVLAIIFPIVYTVKIERRNTFFKIYEYWNADYMQKLRLRFWRIIKENRTEDAKIDLKKMYEKNHEDFHVYERVYDLLNDMARLYQQNHIDRSLVKDFMISFIRMYGNALEENFESQNIKTSFLLKMSVNYYSALINLKNNLCKNEQKIPDNYKEISTGKSNMSMQNR